MFVVKFFNFETVYLVMKIMLIRTGMLE